MKQIFLTMMAAALLVVGLTACGGSSSDNIDPLSTPLTLEAIADGCISFANKASGPVIYKLNGGEERTIMPGENCNIELKAGDKASFLGDNPTYATEHKHSRFSFYVDCYVYGNVMSLINAIEYPTLKSFDAEKGKYAFRGLFVENNHMCNHPSKALVLPATTLSEKCYSEMFKMCKRLKMAPELPAVTMEKGCYRAMFDGCDSITTAPVLPATTLASSCYSFMFAFCGNLTEAPELPVTTLAPNCYGNMFYSCRKLGKAPKLPATKLETNCYNQMFAGCYSLETAPELPATTLAFACYEEMFSGCKNLTTAPELPATVLEENCYSSMFEGCVSLTKAPTLPAPMLVNGCYKSMFRKCGNLDYVKCLATKDADFGWTCFMWLNDVAETGTIVKMPGMKLAIPNGWTVKDVE